MTNTFSISTVNYVPVSYTLYIVDNYEKMCDALSSDSNEFIQLIIKSQFLCSIIYVSFAPADKEDPDIVKSEAKKEDSVKQEVNLDQLIYTISV